MAAKRGRPWRLLDSNAFSMSTEAPSGTRYHELQSRAQEILQSLGANDEIQIVWADATPQLYPETRRNIVRC